MDHLNLLSSLCIRSERRMGGLVLYVSAMALEVCLNHFNTTSFFFLFPPTLASWHHPIQTIVWPLPPVFPREGEVNWSWHELTEELRSGEESEVLLLMELKYSSVVSSALEAIKWQAAEHRSVVMTMSVIKNGVFSSWLMLWENANQDSNKHLIDFIVLESKAVWCSKSNYSRDILSVIDERIQAFLSVLMDTSALMDMR